MATLPISSVLLLFGLIVPLAQSLDSRIVGGQEVDIRDYPYQVSVRIYDQHICGGSIIDEYTILTAAHCVFGFDLSQFSIRYGTTLNAQGTSIPVIKVTMNNNYNFLTEENDVAILKLSSSISFSSTAKAIPLQSTEVPVGTDAWVSGWGVTSEGSLTIPAALRAVDVAVISNTDCNNKYSGKIKNGMICAQTIDHDSCQGDSGGPLVVNGTLIGIVSWGYGCARPEYPGVYAKVSQYIPWITNNI